jgi:hypothetical protein
LQSYWQSDKVLREKEELIMGGWNGIETFEEWIEYFERNGRRLMPIPWEDMTLLTVQERQTISDSVRTFQLGESSEGRNLIRVAEIYERRSPEKGLVGAIQLFIAEENRHAAALARFLVGQQIPLAKRQWTDTVFRTLRRFWNLEVSVSVLLTAELVAKVYYKLCSMRRIPKFSNKSVASCSAMKLLTYYFTQRF